MSRWSGAGDRCSLRQTVLLNIVGALELNLVTSEFFPFSHVRGLELSVTTHTVKAAVFFFSFYNIFSFWPWDRADVPLSPWLFTSWRASLPNAFLSTVSWFRATSPHLLSPWALQNQATHRNPLCVCVCVLQLYSNETQQQTPQKCADLTFMPSAAVMLIRLGVIWSAAAESWEKTTLISRSIFLKLHHVKNILHLHRRQKRKSIWAHWIFI